MNMSMHRPVLWEFQTTENAEEEDEDPFEKIVSKKLPRPDWRNKIDMELYSRLEKIYAEVAMKLTRDLAPPWRIKTLETMLSRASAKARTIPRPND